MLKIRLLAPAVAGLFALFAARSGAATITQNFSANPLQSGWSIFGDTSLFHWNSTNQNLDVTWDSTRTNSYFYHSLGTILNRNDDFSLAFDLRVDDIGAGQDPNKPFAFELVVGFLNRDQATAPSFLRGTGYDSANLFEFDYFWDSGYGATVWPAVIGTNVDYNYNGPSDYTLFALEPGDWHHVAMNYTASNQTLVTTVTNLSQGSNTTVSTLVNSYFTDFHTDAISISSYSDAGQYPGYEGSILAHGAVDNIAVIVPPPPIQNYSGWITNGIWQTRFLSRSNWLYTLERTTDLQTWTNVAPASYGNATNLLLQDTNLPASKAFYRVRAERP